MMRKECVKKDWQNMKVLIDTNVLLDVLCAREDFLEVSLRIWKYCEINKIEGYISALSVPNIVYILRKELTPKRTEEVINQLLLIFKACELKTDDLKKAAAMQHTDYEDALQMIGAARIKADYIVTRNIRDFLISKVYALTPAELLERL